MAAAMVMAFALGAAVIAIQAGMRDLEMARTSTAVAQVLQSEAERLRLMNWPEINALPASETVNPGAEVANARRGGVQITRVVSNVAGFADMKEIVLRATWTGGGGGAHERVVRLRYAKGGLHDYYYGSSGAS